MCIRTLRCKSRDFFLWCDHCRIFEGFFRQYDHLNVNLEVFTRGMTSECYVKWILCKPGGFFYLCNHFHINTEICSNGVINVASDLGRLNVIWKRFFGCSKIFSFQSLSFSQYKAIIIKRTKILLNFLRPCNMFYPYPYYRPRLHDACSRRILKGNEDGEASSAHILSRKFWKNLSSSEFERVSGKKSQLFSPFGALFSQNGTPFPRNTLQIRNYEILVSGSTSGPPAFFSYIGNGTIVAPQRMFILFLKGGINDAADVKPAFTYNDDN